MPATQVKVSAKVKDNVTKAVLEDRKITVNYDFPESLAQALERYGEDLVFKTLMQRMVVVVQDVGRKYLEALPTTSPKEYEVATQGHLDQYIFGTKAERATKTITTNVQELAAILPNVTRARQREILAQLGFPPEFADTLPCAPDEPIEEEEEEEDEEEEGEPEVIGTGRRTGRNR